DFARAYSVQKRIAQGAYSAALALSDPSYSNSEVANYIAAQAGLSSGSVSVTKTYSADLNGNNHITITAGYQYSMLLPGLQALRVGGITNGKLAIGVRATRSAPTNPPTI